MGTDYQEFCNESRTLLFVFFLAFVTKNILSFCDYTLEPNDYPLKLLQLNSPRKKVYYLLLRNNLNMAIGYF